MPVTYYKKKAIVKNGRLVIQSGSYAFSAVIQNLTKSARGHVAVVYKNEELGRVLVLDAELYTGIRLIPLSRYLRNFKDKKRPYKGQIAFSQSKLSRSWFAFCFKSAAVDETLAT
jgi:tRNA G10  N-methylase Trm11